MYIFSNSDLELDLIDPKINPHSQTNYPFVLGKVHAPFVLGATSDFSLEVWVDPPLGTTTIN